MPIQAASMHSDTSGSWRGSLHNPRLLHCPFALSFRCTAMAASIHSSNGCLNCGLSIVCRSLRSFPSKTVNANRSRSMSCTRNCKHSLKRNPLPYRSWIISLFLPWSCPRILGTSSPDNTVGTRHCFVASRNPKSPTVLLRYFSKKTRANPKQICVLGRHAIASKVHRTPNLFQKLASLTTTPFKIVIKRLPG